MGGGATIIVARGSRKVQYEFVQLVQEVKMSFVPSALRTCDPPPSSKIGEHLLHAQTSDRCLCELEGVNNVSKGERNGRFAPFDMFCHAPLYFYQIFCTLK